MKFGKNLKLGKVSTRLTHRRIDSRIVALGLLLSLLIILLPAIKSKVTAAGQSQKEGAEFRLSDSALAQIQALLAEKESRTPAQKKIDSQLVYALKQNRGESLAASVPALETGLAIDDGRTVVDITAKFGGTLIEDIAATGADVLLTYPQYNTLRAIVPLDQLEKIAGFPQVIFIMPKQEANVWRAAEPGPAASAPIASAPASKWDVAPDFADRAARVRSQLMAALPKLGQQPQQPNVGSQNSQGDATHKANTARSTFGANGAGVRIGVLSNGVVSLAASQALGDLGPVTVLPGQTGTGDEGTAMLEIVHDLAPGAELFFATANPIIAAFAQNIRDLRTAGCDIIIDDVFYFVESPFQDGQATGVVSNTNGGIVTQAVNDVTAAGTLYFSSAGNQGNLTDNTSSCYQGDFVNGGTLTGANGGNVHDFGGGAQSDLIQTGSGNPINLYWADPLGGATNDYDLFVFNNALTTVVASSTNVQSGTQDPLEQTGTGNTTNNRIVVLKKTGSADRFFHITINANGVGRLGTATDGTTKGHSMSSLAYSVAATPAASPGPFPNPHSAANVSETFSSDGPRRIFFTDNGTPITPGNFSSTGGTLRQKPDITAADRVSVTGVGGFPTTFSGTSAAAPHAGAIAALLLSQFPNLTPAQVRTILINTAIDIETAGVDRTTGAGIIMPFEAEQSNGAVASANFETNTITASEICCNGNTFIEPGESGSLVVGLTNTGAAAATAISATLSTTTPNVSIINGTSAYPNLAAPAGMGNNNTLFTFSLSTLAPCDLKINFTMTITYTGGNSPKVAKFSVQTGRPPVLVATTIDATAPPASTDYTAVTGTQTNRVTRDGRASTCNLPKAVCPGVTAATSPRFDAYTFSTCSSATPRCITVRLNTPCPTVAGGTQLFATVYSGSFVPASICANYLADSGSSPAANGTVSFTFNVPGSSTFVVVVSDVPGTTTTNCNCNLTVSGVCAACPTAAKVDNFNASSFKDGRVLLEWNSAQEVDNLGYNVYREVGGQRFKITPQLVAGSALITGPNVALSAGKSYAWADQPQAGTTARYWLEAIDLKGNSSWTGPISIKPSNTSLPVNLQQSALMSRIGLAQAQMSIGQGSTAVENRATPVEMTPATMQAQRDLSGSTAIKMGINREGYYRIAQPDLLAAGLDANVNPRNLQLYVDGQAIPMAVNGEQDGRFDAVDSVEFYGVGLNSPVTDTQVYWLATGLQPGTRIKSLRATGGTPSPAGFPYTVERKDRTLYFAALKNGDAENFFGPVVASAPVDQSLTLTALAATASPATLDVSVQGVTQNPHRARVLLNGLSVGTISFEGQAQGRASFPIPQSQLREGVNSVQLSAQGGGSDISLIDTVRITYLRKFTADGNTLRLVAQGGQQVSIGGFTSSGVRVMDVTDMNAPQELTGAALGGKSSQSITLTVPGTGLRTLFAFAADRVQSVTPKANRPSNLRDGGISGDYVMITTQDLSASFNPLKLLRQNQGLSVFVADVEDIYDEFSFGNKSPQAIRSFLEYANSNWRVRPRFVLLAGDSSYDPRNYLGFGNSDLVPTKLYDSVYLESATDDWFADFDLDGVSNLAIGRLPARTASEATLMASKIISYENSSGSNSALLAADTTEGFGFSSVNTLLRTYLPSGMQVREINRGSASDSAIRSQLLAAINQGQSIINYNGHGSVSLWRGEILTNNDAAAMTNTQKLSLFVMMTCLNGYFADPALDSLGESVLKANAGAFGVWASAAQCDPSAQAAMNQELYRILFDGSRLTIGEATARAKSSINDTDVRRSWIYLGDPATRLK